MGEPKIPGGYYIKSRKIQKSSIMKQPPHVREIWDYLLMNANYEDAVLTGGRRIKRGQLFRRHKRIRDDLSWVVGWRKETYNENQMKKAMKFLREALMIASTKEPGGVLITILNYDLYQNPENYERTKEGTSDRTIEEPLKNQGVPTYDKKNKEEEEERIKKEEEQNGPKPSMANIGQGINDDNCPDNSSSLDRDCLPDGNLAIESETVQEAARETKEVIDDVSGNLHPGLCVADSINSVDNQDDKGSHPVVSRDHEQKKVVKNDMHRDTTTNINLSSNSDIGNYCVLNAERNKDDPFGDIGKNAKGVKSEALEAKKKNKVELPPEPKKQKKEKNGISLDLSKVDSVFDKAIVEEFIDFRKMIKKNPLTPRALDGVCRNAKKVKEKYGGTENDVLIYAMEQKWLTPDTKYLDDNPGRYRAFLDDQSGGSENKEDSVKEKIADLERRAKIAQRKWEEDQRTANA